MAQVASAVKPALTLAQILSNAWTQIVRSSNQSLSKGMYGEDIAFSDSLERELSDRELHPYTF